MTSLANPPLASSTTTAGTVAVLILTNVLKVRRRGDAATQRDARSPPAAALPLNVDHQPLTTTHHGDRRSTSGNIFRPCASVSP